MAAAATTAPFRFSASSSSTSSSLLLLRQVLLMPAASSDFKAAAFGALFGAGAALLVSHLLLELTFSSIFSTFFAVLFFLLSLLVLQRAFTIHCAVPPPLLPAKDQERKIQQQQQACGPTTVSVDNAAAGVAITDRERQKEGEEEGGTGVVVVSAAESSRGDVEEIYLEEEREDAEAESLLQQEHLQQEFYRFQKEQRQMRRLLFWLAGMLAGSALVAAVIDTRKFQTFHWLLKVSVYVLLSNSLCFLLVFAAVDIVNFYYDVAHPEKRKGGGSYGGTAATTPAGFASPAYLSSSSHYLYTALSASRPLLSHSSLADTAYFPVATSSSPSSLPLHVTAGGGGSIGSAAAAATDSIFSSSLGISHTFFSPSAVRGSPPEDSSIAALAATSTGSLPVHNTLQVYVLLGGSLLLGTTFGFFYGMFRFEASPHTPIQLIRSRYVCVPLAAVIGPLAGVLVKRIGDISSAAAAACMLQQSQQSFGPVPYFNSSSLAAAAGIHQPTTAAAAASHLPLDTAPATATCPAAASAIPSPQQQHQLFPISTAANFLEAEEEEEVEEENLLTFSAIEHRQLLLLA